MAESLEQVHETDDEAVRDGGECYSCYISPKEATIPSSILFLEVVNLSVVLIVLAVDRHLDILRVRWCSRGLGWHSAAVANPSVD